MHNLLRLLKRMPDCRPCLHARGRRRTLSRQGVATVKRGKGNCSRSLQDNVNHSLLCFVFFLPFPLTRSSGSRLPPGSRSSQFSLCCCPSTTSSQKRCPDPSPSPGRVCPTSLCSEPEETGYSFRLSPSRGGWRRSVRNVPSLSWGRPRAAPPVLCCAREPAQFSGRHAGGAPPPKQ